MAITVNGTIDSFLYSDTPLPLTLTGSGFSAPYDKVLWESPDGVFSDYLSETPNFTSYDRTKSVIIYGRRVARMYSLAENNWTSVTNVTLANGNNGTATKTGGSNGTWDAKVVGNIFSADLNCLLDFRAGDVDKDKAGGFSDVTTEMNPANSGFRFAWRMMDNGLAMPYHAGVALLSVGLAYNENTRFKLQKTGTSMKYYIDSVEVASVVVGGTFNYYPILTFKNTNASIKSTMFMQQDGANYVDDLTFQVYAVLPEQPNWGYELSKDNITLASIAEDGSATLRVKNKAKRSYSLQYTERPFEEYIKISDFWDYHQKHIKFYYRDIVFDKLVLVRFDTGLKLQPVGADRITMSCVIREV